MSVGIAGCAQISTTVFGGLVTEQSAVDIPEGVSPDNQDVEYVPGSVYSRRCLNRTFVTPFGLTTVSYAKSFVMPNNDIRNLYLDSAGNLWWEDISNAPGIYQFLVRVQGQTYAKSITAFGKEYIAITDGLHGQDVPLQWDGTYLDRVTQDGPGAAPQVVNYSLPAVSMAGTGSAPTATISGVFPDQKVNGYFTTLNIYTTVAQPLATPGTVVYVNGLGGGGAIFNNTTTGYLVVSNPGPAGGITVTAYFPGATGSYVGSGTLTIGTGSFTLVRQGNVVSVQCGGPHNLQVGYQALIGPPPGNNVLPPLAVGGGILNIVINNESQPGLATITMTSAHGLVPGNNVIIEGVGAVIAGGISGILWSAGIATVTTAVPHGLAPGALVTINAGGTGGDKSGDQGYFFSGNFPVLQVVSTYSFTYALTPFLPITVGTTAYTEFPNSYAGQMGDTVTVNFPAGSTVEQNTYEVVSAPSPTSFQVAIEYADASWSSGTVAFPWNGTFFVQTVPSTTTFTYQQYGPNGYSTTAGVVTPFGQIAPGLKQMQVLFLTRQGYITRPSPPVNIECNGGQYLSVTNIPTGPPNVVARILAFTGSGGGLFFYIPTPPQSNKQIVATPTQINDNVSTAAILDFSDNTLFAEIAISIPGNTLANQIILDGALGFGFYAGRLVTWGQRNRIQNLLNMGFEGGAFYTTPTLPCGWNNTFPGGLLVPGWLTGLAWQINLSPGHSGALVQSMYQDAYGVPIAQPNTFYAFRCWTAASTAANAVYATLTSASTGFLATAGPFGAFPTAGFMQANFNQKTPGVIPTDLVLTVYGQGPGGNIIVDEMSVIYASNPYLDNTFYMSYVNNPEGFDGLTGKSGSIDDSHKIMDVAALRQSLFYLTQDPGGKLNETSDNGTTEPSGWTYANVAANCGLLSAFALTKSQADDTSAAGGEEWFAWASATGGRIFGGDQPWKITQEIQPNWDNISVATPFVGQTAFPVSAYLTSWALNDPDSREILFGLPMAVPGSGITNPNQVLVVSYRELETAFQIGTTGPIHTSFTGKLIATDHARKWTRWNMTMNGAALMYRPPQSANLQANPNLQVVLFGGNGAPLGLFNGFGNVYTLNPNKFTDDDYGLIAPYYVCYFAPSHEQEQQLSWQMENGQKVPLGAGRKLLAYASAFVGAPATQINTQSQLIVSFYANTLSNTFQTSGGLWPLNVTRTLVPNPTFDLECGGGSTSGNRIAIKFASSPLLPSSLDNGFSLSHLSLWFKGARLTIRGAAQ